MTKILILLIGLMAMLPETASADYFKFLDSNTQYYIPNARVILDGRTIGNTDAYGRIRVELANGDYQVQIEFRGGLKTTRLHIDGGRTLKTAEAR